MLVAYSGKIFIDRFWWFCFHRRLLFQDGLWPLVLGFVSSRSDSVGDLRPKTKSR
jgi:hypothetical protein